MANIVAQNILFSIIRYTEVSDVRKKISWLRTASVLMKRQLENDTLIKRLESCQNSLSDILEYNWEVFEKYKQGYFDLLSKEEYISVLKKLAELENIKDELLDILVEAGYSDVPFPPL